MPKFMNKLNKTVIEVTEDHAREVLRDHTEFEEIINEEFKQPEPTEDVSGDVQREESDGVQAVSNRGKKQRRRPQNPYN